MPGLRAVPAVARLVFCAGHRSGHFGDDDRLRAPLEDSTVSVRARHPTRWPPEALRQRRRRARRAGLFGAPAPAVGGLSLHIVCPTSGVVRQRAIGLGDRDEDRFEALSLLAQVDAEEPVGVPLSGQRVVRLLNVAPLSGVFHSENLVVIAALRQGPQPFQRGFFRRSQTSFVDRQIHSSRVAAGDPPGLTILRSGARPDLAWSQSSVSDPLPRLCTSTRVSRSIHPQQMGRIDVGIALGGTESFVSKLFLNRSKVSAGRQHVRGAGMPQRMWMDPCNPRRVSRLPETIRRALRLDRRPPGSSETALPSRLKQTRAADGARHPERPLPAGRTARCVACPLCPSGFGQVAPRWTHRSSQAPPLRPPGAQPRRAARAAHGCGAPGDRAAKDAASRHPLRVPRESGAPSGAPVVPAAIPRDSSGGVLLRAPTRKKLRSVATRRARLAGAGRLPGVPRLASHPRSCRRSALARLLPRHEVFFEVPQIRRISPDGVRRRTTVPLKVRQPIFEQAHASASHAIIQYRQTLPAFASSRPVVYPSASQARKCLANPPAG